MPLKHNELAPCLLVFDNCFKPKTFIDEVEAECSQPWGYLSWYMSKVGTSKTQSERPDYRSSLLCDLGVLNLPPEAVSEQRILPLVEAWHNIYGDLQKVIWTYRNMYNIDVKEDEGFAINKYGRGAEYKGHVDHHPTNQRVFSIVAFLNDNFDGGELVFPLLDISIKPQAGSAVMFPSNFPYYHYANQVGAESSNEVKYSLVTWFR